MKRAIDSDRGRKINGRRIAIVEPVFGNLRHKKRFFNSLVGPHRK